LRYADLRNIEKLTLIGHNIGGKTAMTLSCLYPERVNAIISLDTLPKSFKNNS
jgi:esterase